jgi:hypothetical protein
MSEMFVRVYVDGATPIDVFEEGSVNAFEVSLDGSTYRANTAGTTLSTVHRWMQDERFRIVRISVETEQQTAVFKLSDEPVGQSEVTRDLVDGTSDAPMHTPALADPTNGDREAAVKAIEDVNKFLEERGPVRNPIRLETATDLVVPAGPNAGENDKFFEDISPYDPWGS